MMNLGALQGAVNTGDITNIGLYIGIFIVALVLIVGIIVIRKLRNRNK